MRFSNPQFDQVYVIGAAGYWLERLPRRPQPRRRERQEFAKKREAWAKLEAFVSARRRIVEIAGVAGVR